MTEYSVPCFGSKSSRPHPPHPSTPIHLKNTSPFLDINNSFLPDWMTHIHHTSEHHSCQSNPSLSGWGISVPLARCGNTRPKMCSRTWRGFSGDAPPQCSLCCTPSLKRSSPYGRWSSCQSPCCPAEDVQNQSGQTAAVQHQMWWSGSLGRPSPWKPPLPWMTVSMTALSTQTLSPKKFDRVLKCSYLPAYFS